METTVRSRVDLITILLIFTGCSEQITRRFIARMDEDLAEFCEQVAHLVADEMMKNSNEMNSFEMKMNEGGRGSQGSTDDEDSVSSHVSYSSICSTTSNTTKKTCPNEFMFTGECGAEGSSDLQRSSILFVEAVCERPWEFDPNSGRSSHSTSLFGCLEETYSLNTELNTNLSFVLNSMMMMMHHFD